jgi:chromosome partitioning protein
MRIVALANQKGGVGKSTIAVHMAASLADHGARTLLIDLDAQANASAGLAIDVDPDETVSRWLPWNEGEPGVHPVEGYDNLAVVPGHISLADEEYEAIENRVSPTALAEQLRQFALPYDWVVIDMPPSLAFWARVGFMAADRILIPAQPAHFSYIGLRQLLVRVESIRLRQSPRLRALGIVASNVDGRTYYGREFRSMLAGVLDNHTPLFETIIPTSAAIVRAQGAGVTTFDLDPQSRISRAFDALVEEVNARWQEKN